MEGARPSGTVTFLFTDIEGSTRLWEQHPDEMKTALASHDMIVRNVIEAHGGYVFATGGDGFAAAFATAQDAIDSALDAQRQIGDAFQAGIELRVRMGMNSGNADERDDDYFGPVVNQAARIMDAAHGGQVLASTSAASMLSESAHLVPLGEHRLRGIARRIPLVQINETSDSRRFPPPRADGPAQGNVQLPVSAFVGRVAELDGLADRLSEQRLVTVTGVGGTGKTRLAIEAADRLADKYPDGAWIAELAEVSDQDTVADYVAAVFGLRPQPGSTPQLQLVDWLRGSRTLLILDNCEHVISAAADLAQAITESCPATRVLATSREPLLIDGESVFPLPSLQVESADGELAPAVELFESRVVAERGSWDPSTGTREQVQELCRRLDGMPLAIELAAARARTMSVAEVLDRLDARFKLLTGGRRASVERHKTLRATVDWSYQLLSPTAQLVFDRASVFSGRFGLRDVTIICGDDTLDEMDVVDAFADLVDKCMVETQPELAGGEYRLLETMRAFGAEKAEMRSETVALRNGHAAHYAAVVAELQRELIGSRELEVRRQAELAASDLRAALDWAAVSQDESTVRAISGGLVWFCFCGWLDPLRWIQGLGDTPIADAREIAEVVAFANFVLEGDPALAEGRLGERNDPLDLSYLGLFTLAACSMLAGQPERGKAPAEKMLALGTESDDPAERAFAAFGLANIKAILGEPDEELAARFLTAARTEGSRTAQSYALSTGARMFMHSDRDKAIQMLEAACDLAMSVASGDALGNALNVLLSPNIDGLPLEGAADQAVITLEQTRDLGNAAVQRSALGLAQIVLQRRGQLAVAALVSGHLEDRRQPISPVEQDRYDNSVGLLEAMLDPVTLIERRETGRSMSTREITNEVVAMLRTKPV
jgi:predicted ATPase/class 3 adenylate cyclase